MSNDWQQYTTSEGNEDFFATKDAEALRATDSALLIRFTDGTEEWVPKSQISDESEVYAAKTSGLLVVTRWLAEKRDWA